MWSANISSVSPAKAPCSIFCGAATEKEEGVNGNVFALYGRVGVWMAKRGKGEIREGFSWYYRKSNRASPGKVLYSDYVYTFIQSLYRSVSDTWSIVQSTTDQNKTAILEHLGISLVSFQWCLYN